MVKKVNTKSNELTKKTRKVIKKTKDVKKVKGGSKDSRNFSTEFNNLVNLYYLLEMVLNIKKYYNIMAISGFHELNENEKIDTVSNILINNIILNNDYRFARKKQGELDIFAKSIKENLTIKKFGMIKDSGSYVDIDAFLAIRIRNIREKIIKHINMGNAYFFNYTRSSNIFRKNLKSNKIADEYRTEEDFLSDLFLGDIHFYLRNTATSQSDFTVNQSVFVGNSSRYKLKSIDFNKITDDKIKIIIFYIMLKFTFNVDNLRRLIICPTELKFFMYGDNIKDLNLNIQPTKIFDTNCNDNQKQTNDSSTIKNYIDNKMPIINSINNVKDYEVKILYDRYLRYIKDSNNVFSISSFFEFIGYKFNKLPVEKSPENINKALNEIFDEFINKHLSDINIVTSPNKELSFSQLLSNLNKLHDKIFLLDNLKDTFYTKLSGNNPLNITRRNNDKQNFVNGYRKFMLDITKFIKDKVKGCDGEISEDSKNKLKEYIMYDINKQKYQKALRSSSFINDIRNINSYDEQEKYFNDLKIELDNIFGSFTKIRKTGVFRNNAKSKDQLYNLYLTTKDALEEFSKCKNFYKIIIDIDPYTQVSDSNIDNGVPPPPPSSLPPSLPSPPPPEPPLLASPPNEGIPQQHDSTTSSGASQAPPRIPSGIPRPYGQMTTEERREKMGNWQNGAEFSKEYHTGPHSVLGGGKAKNKKKLTQKEKDKLKKEKAKEKAKKEKEKAKEKAKKEKEKAKEKAKKEKEKAKEKAKKEKEKAKVKKITKKK